MNKKIEDIIEKYSNQAIVRSMVSLIPSVGGAIDVYLTTTLNNMKTKRIETFFDELLKNNLNAPDQLLKSESFLSKYFLTLELVLQTHQEEKIKMFAKMLSNSFHEDKLDEYEDYLKILNELSYRELFILTILDNYHLRYKKRFPNENDFVISNKYWDEFNKEIEEKLNISVDEIEFLLVRIARSGCYELFTGKYMPDNNGQGKVTIVWDKLKKQITQTTSL